MFFIFPVERGEEEDDDGLVSKDVPPRLSFRKGKDAEREGERVGREEVEREKKKRRDRLEYHRWRRHRFLRRFEPAFSTANGTFSLLSVYEFLNCDVLCL